ncbi:D-amino-acid transaminase [Mesorhizobium sp. Z1-4]|uniref:D-amino-acid transaminase n=1 Tax=Mesorhizobium sp. Z1-4 TaxID=2448478 RepID=UPI000FDB2A6A|nr:D-amino-acid transaminase [Mesorhizobium sp. Z1-4]
MSRIAYVNGRYVPHARAAVHVEDRGYQFADGVYEVCEVKHGFIIDMSRHLDRLGRSLGELSILWPVHRSALQRILVEVVRRNRIRNGLVYLQVTRGVAKRDHAFPAPDTRPALVVTASRMSPGTSASMAEAGIAVVTVPDNRWDRVDIKTVGLLPNVLARQEAKDAGAQEAWFVDADGIVMEGSSTNAWIVTRDGVIVTRSAEYGILRGITRTTLFDVADRLGVKIEERGFTVAEAQEAREAFVTSATKTVMPVVSINGRPVGNGHPGSVAAALRAAFFDIAEKTDA